VAPSFGRAQCDKQTRGVSQCGLAIYIKKYLKAKEEIWKLKYITMQKYPHIKIDLLLLPRGQNPLSYYYTL
jgi:hypothetical protein